MLNIDTRLASVHSRLLEAMNVAAEYVSPASIVAEPPQGGTNEYTKFCDCMNTIGGIVTEAIELTHEKRVGKYGAVDMGKRIAECQNTDKIDTDIFDSKRSYFNLYKRYEGFAPIFGRKYRIERADTKINNHLSNDFFGEICDDKASFTLGTPAWYSSSEAAQDAVLQDFVRSADIAELDLDTMTLSTICGVAYRYFWIGEESLKVTLAAPWDVVYLDFDNVKIAIMLSKSGEDQHAEVFCGTSYVKMSLKDFTAAEIKYNFLGCPFVAYPNNPQWQSDCYKVLELMDAYDRIVSDSANEAEQMRLAYLVIEGAIELIGEEAKDFAERLKDSGIIQTPAGTSANFISKSMQMDAIISLLALIEANIYRFSKSLNYNSKSAGEQPTAFALKQRLTALKNKCYRSWMSFNNANREQWQMLAVYQAISNKPALDPDTVTAQVKFNIPVDLKEEVAVVTQLMTIVSKETALKQLSIFENDEAVQAELVKMERDGIDPNILDEGPPVEVPSVPSPDVEVEQ